MTWPKTGTTRTRTRQRLVSLHRALLRKPGGMQVVVTGKPEQHRRFSADPRNLSRSFWRICRTDRNRDSAQLDVARLRLKPFFAPVAAGFDQVLKQRCVGTQHFE